MEDLPGASPIRVTQIEDGFGLVILRDAERAAPELSRASLRPLEEKEREFQRSLPHFILRLRPLKGTTGLIGGSIMTV